MRTKNKLANTFWCLLWSPYSAVYEESVKGWKIKGSIQKCLCYIKKAGKKKKRGSLVSSDFDLISGSNKQLMQIIQQQSGAIILNICPLFLQVKGLKPVFIFWKAPQCIHSASTVHPQSVRWGRKSFASNTAGNELCSWVIILQRNTGDTNSYRIKEG